VLHSGHYSIEKKVNADLAKYCQVLSLYNGINQSPTAYGYARLDAFGRIYNRVEQYILTPKELTDEYDRLTENLASAGTLKNPQTVDRKGRLSIASEKSLNDREELIDQLSKSVAKGNTYPVIEKLFNPPNAPVSYLSVGHSTARLRSMERYPCKRGPGAAGTQTAGDPA
jgi:hypothetical protein